MRVALAVLLVSMIACGGKETASSTATPSQPAQAAAATPNLTPEQLGELGAKIRKEPARADELLAEKGLTQQTFEKAIRDVTENPDASKRYTEAYKRVSG